MSAGRLRGVGLWSAATMVATGISFTAVAVVTDRVTTADVVAAPDPVSASSPLDLPTTTVPTTTPTTSGVVRTTSTTSVPTTAPVPTRPVRPVRERPTPTSVPTSVPPPTPSTPVAASYGSPGGVVSVACEGPAISLQGARPNDGFRLEVLASGPRVVDVVFDGPAEDSRIAVVCIEGQPQRVRPRDDRSGPGDGTTRERRSDMESPPPPDR